MPYTVITGQRLPSQRWTARDRTLAEALLEYEDSFCPGCGQPKSKAWNDKTDGWWEQESLHCFACEMIENQRKIAEKSDKESEPGELTYMTLDDGWEKER